MEFLDYVSERTLNLTLVLTNYALMGVFIILKPIYKKSYVTSIIIGHCSLATGILLIQLRGIIPLFLTIILGNILNVYGGYKILHGILDMISIKINSKFYAIGLGVFVVIHTYFTYSQSNVAARIMNYSFFYWFDVPIILLHVY